MDKKILLKKIFDYFKIKDIPDSLNEQRKLYKELVLSLKEYDIPDEILNTEDKYLVLELMNKKLTDGEKYNPINVNLSDSYRHGDVVCLWEGDLSCIYADVLINPVNSNFDLDKNNSVYLNAGMKLRKKCLDLIKEKKLNPTEVLITRAYNLISDFIIHVVLPSEDNYDTELAMCYFNVLECANNNIAKTVVLRDISNNNSKDILVKTIMDYLDRKNCTIEKIIIAALKDDDFEEYIHILEQYKETTE